MKDLYRDFLDLYEENKSGVVREDEKKYTDACKEFKKAELSSKPSASLLVKKGECIQLSSEACPYSLKDAEKAFKDAIEEDENYVEAYLELAYYYFHVQDDVKTALPYFEEAIRISCEFASESVCGIALCAGEIKSPKIALKYLKDNHRLRLSDSILKKTMNEIEKNEQRGL